MKMEYRRLPKGNEKISILGLGTSSMGASGDRECQEIMDMALKNGINYFDMASADCRATLSGSNKQHFIITSFPRKKAQPHLNGTVMPLFLHFLSSMPGY